MRLREHGGIQCSEWIAAEKRECGRWTYVIAQAGGGVIAVDVSLDELNELEKLHTVTEIIDYFGIFPE